MKTKESVSSANQSNHLNAPNLSEVHCSVLLLGDGPLQRCAKKWKCLFPVPGAMWLCNKKWSINDIKSVYNSFRRTHDTPSTVILSTGNRAASNSLRTTVSYIKRFLNALHEDGVEHIIVCGTFRFELERDSFKSSLNSMMMKATRLHTRISFIQTNVKFNAEAVTEWVYTQYRSILGNYDEIKDEMEVFTFKCTRKIQKFKEQETCVRRRSRKPESNLGCLRTKVNDLLFLSDQAIEAVDDAQKAVKKTSAILEKLKLQKL